MLEWPEGGPSRRPRWATPALPGGRRRCGDRTSASPDGGTMAQPVVYRIAQACRHRGLATCGSTSAVWGGAGAPYSGTESTGTCEAAAAFLRSRMAAPTATQCRGRAPAAGAGRVSFGSVMARMAAVGPCRCRPWPSSLSCSPGTELPPDTLTGWPTTVDRCSRSAPRTTTWAIRRTWSGFSTDLKLDFTLSVVEGAGHFLEGRQREVGERSRPFLAEALAAACSRRWRVFWSVRG